MATKRKSGKMVKITPPQINAIADAGNMLSSMIGVGSDFDIVSAKIVRLIDNFLKANGMKRSYK